jgi:hypothetical protein
VPGSRSARIVMIVVAVIIIVSLALSAFLYPMAF